METVEGDLPSEEAPAVGPKPESESMTLARLWLVVEHMGFEAREAFRKLTGLASVMMETRRYRDDRDRDPDYERDLRRLEGGIRDGEPSLRMGNYHEGGGKEPSWRDWMLNILGGLIVVGIGAVIYQLEDLKSSMAASLARQEMDEHRLDRMEQRVYRGGP